MSESQSRYSIIERLTNRKLNILDEVNNLDKEIRDMANTIAIKKKELDSFKQESIEETNRGVRSREREIETITLHKQNKEASLKTRKDSYEAKLREIDKGLAQLSEVSKSSAEEAKGS